MNPKLSFFAFAFFIILASACSTTTYVQSAVTEPARLRLDKVSASVVLINRYDAAQLRLKRDKKTEVYRQGALGMLDEVAATLAEKTGLNVILAFDSVRLARNIHSALDSSVLSSADLKKFASHYRADYVLSLESYHAGFHQDEVEKTRNSDGTTSKTAHYSIYTESTWVLYDIAADSFTELRGNATRPHSSRAVISGIFAFGPATTPNAGDFLPVSRTAAKSLLLNFGETRSEVARLFYTGKPFREAIRKMREHSPEEAENILRPLATHTNHGLASKALYNLAVISDLRGMSASARDLADLSMQKKKNRLAASLLRNLDEPRLIARSR